MATDESNAVDCTGLSRSIWLVKVPKYVSETWAKADSSGIVGSLKIDKGHGKQVNFELADHLSKLGSIDGVPLPRDHKLLMSDMSQSMAVFSEATSESKEKGVADSDTQFAFEGKIVKRADCRPIENPGYLSLKKNAIRLAVQPKRKTQQITGLVPATNFKPVRDHKFNIEREKKRKDEGKRARAEREEVLEMLYSAFEKHQYYGLKDLVKLTQQPVVYLKSILKDICVYNIKAPHKNTYELKPEYRHYKNDEASEKYQSSDT
eukprot:gene10808-11962_t